MTRGPPASEAGEGPLLATRSWCPYVEENPEGRQAHRAADLGLCLKGPCSGPVTAGAQPQTPGPTATSSHMKAFL